MLEVVGGDVLELREHLTRFRPFAVLAECDVPNHGLERIAVHIGGELVIIGALSRFHRLGEHLPRRIAERHEAVAERIDALACGFGLIAIEQIGDAGEFERRRAHKTFADDEAVGERAKLHLDRCDQHADHRAAEHFWHEIDFICRADDADVVGRVGGDKYDIGVCRLHGAHDRQEIGCRRWVGALVRHVEAESFGVVPRGIGGGLGELGIGGDDGHGLRLR